MKETLLTYLLSCATGCVLIFATVTCFANHAYTENALRAGLRHCQSYPPMSDSARLCAEELLPLAVARKDYLTEAELHYLIGRNAYLRLDQTACVFHYKRARTLYHDLGLTEKEGLALERTGMGYLQGDMLDSALLTLRNTIVLYQKHNLDHMSWSPRVNLSMLYQRQGNSELALTYAKEAVEILQETDDRTTKVVALNHIMNLTFGLDSFRLYAHYADMFYRLYDPLEINASLIQHLGQYASITNPSDREQAILSAIQHLEKLPVSLEIVSSYQQLGDTYAALENWEKAVRSWEFGLALTKDNPGLGRFQPLLLESLSNAYRNMGQPGKALDAFTAFVGIRDSLNAVYAKSRIDELQIQYETETKDARIAAQNLTLERRTHQRNIILGITAILVLGMLYILYSRQKLLKARKTIEKQQRLMHETEIRDLNKEHKLSTMRLLINAQEEERTRIAQDLHDSLGASLASLRMQLTASGAPNTTAAVHTLDALSSEVRRISHNMMPQALIRMGLPAALEDLAGSIRLSRDLDVSFQNIDYTEPLDQEKEITLYRIAQELCTNTLRHSGARNLLIQLSRYNGSATLVVEDDGQGFSQDAVTDGIGLQNIRSRVAYLGGDFEVISQPGEGTSMNIQIPAA